jgi:hypothetical protein
MIGLRRQRPLVAWTPWERQVARSFEYRQIHRDLKRPRVEPYSPPRYRRSWTERVLTVAAWIGGGAFAWLVGC